MKSCEFLRVVSTRRLVHDPGLRAAMSQQAIATSQQFGKAHFLARIDTILENLFKKQVE